MASVLETGAAFPLALDIRMVVVHLIICHKLGSRPSSNSEITRCPNAVLRDVGLAKRFHGLNDLDGAMLEGVISQEPLPRSPPYLIRSLLVVQKEPIQLVDIRVIMHE